MRRIRRWLATFSPYQQPVSEQAIRAWLELFKAPDRDTAARVLDAVRFINSDGIAAAYRSALSSLPGWHVDPSRRKGKWRFASFSGPGKSGDSMLHRFRTANELTGKAFSDLFVYRSDLGREAFESSDQVVLVDDFAGTGTQAIDAWPQISELVGGVPTVSLILVAATNRAVEAVAGSTDLRLIAHNYLDDCDDLFSTTCPYFSQGERQALLRYCSLANSANPKGYGATGVLLVFAHNCPNNSLPILWASHERWEGLFPRHV